MATMISEVYDAFRSAGVPEDKARAAAEALSADQLATKADIARLERVTTSEIAKLERVTMSEITKLERITTGELAKLELATTGQIAKVEKEIVVIKWMLGLVIVAVVVPLIRPFFA
jgi:hypothetical protein